LSPETGELGQFRLVSSDQQLVDLAGFLILRFSQTITASQQGSFKIVALKAPQGRRFKNAHTLERSGDRERSGRPEIFSQSQASCLK